MMGLLFLQHWVLFRAENSMSRLVPGRGRIVILTGFQFKRISTEKSEEVKTGKTYNLDC